MGGENAIQLLFRSRAQCGSLDKWQSVLLALAGSKVSLKREYFNGAFSFMGKDIWSVCQ